MNSSKAPRASWSSQLGFVFAAAASAVGLGNIWRFPYLAAKYGGGIFLLCYLVLVVTLGFTMMTAEVAIGRRTGLAPFDAIRAIRRRWAWLGWLCTLVPAIILPYYCIVGGWVLRYFTHYALAVFGLGGADPTAFVPADPSGAAGAAGYFSNFISGSGPIAYGIAFTLACCALILLGVRRGIEKSNLVLMPMLIALCFVVAGVSLAQPGAGAGLVYYLKPDFSKFSYKTVVTAMGQMFYSLSLAMGIMIAYGSYMRKEDSIERSVRRIEVFDTLVAVLAGLMVIPAVYAIADPADPAHGMNGGAGLMFMNLPGVFRQMAGTNAVAALFFLLVLFAALTSCISIYETCVASLCDRTGWARRRASLVTLVYALLLGLPSALGYGSGPLGGEIWHGMTFLDFSDFLANNVLMPVAAFFIAVLVGWVVGPGWVAEEVRRGGAPFRAEKLFSAIVRWFAPGLILVILVAYVLDGLGLAKFAS